MDISPHPNGQIDAAFRMSFMKMITVVAREGQGQAS
ncbi:hypothetical protein SAMN05444678_10932 [Sphingomonas sp. YR710]|nr:hypothetical protein SAMN05444678_10932 [Sphingomonas sp. YR710]